MQLREILNILRKYIPVFVRQNFLLKRIFIYSFSKFILIKKLKKQLSNNEISSNKFSKIFKKKVLINLIITDHNPIHRYLILGKALELRGCEVKVLICNKFLDACELKNIKNRKDNNPCWDCKFNIDNILPIYNLQLIDMKSIIPYEKEDIWRKHLIKKGLDYKRIQKLLPFKMDVDDVKKIINESVVRYFFGKVSLNLKMVNEIKFRNIMALLKTSYIAKKIDKLWDPDIVLSCSYGYSSWGPFYEYYKKNGNRYADLVNSNLNNNAVVLKTFDLYPARERYLSFENTLKNKELSQDQNLELDNFLNTRFSGKNQVALDNSFFKDLDSSSIKNKLSLNNNKRNLFLFPNVFWDAGVNNRDFLFKDVLSWVRRTIELVSNCKSLDLYIKIHPNEKNASTNAGRIGVADIMRKEFDFNLPRNIFFIEPEMKIKPYDLIPFMDLAIIFSGTLGLEISLNEKPVVSTGVTVQHDLGLINQPESEKEYEMLLKGEKKAKCPSIKEVRKFAYFYFIKCCIPWDLQESVYGDYFSGFKFDRLDDLKEGKNKYLDHICECLVDKENKIIENW